ncbi:hypothetical protein ACHAPT_010898 [Fusarium lateritium]
MLNDETVLNMTLEPQGVGKEALTDNKIIELKLKYSYSRRCIVRVPWPGVVRYELQLIKVPEPSQKPEELYLPTSVLQSVVVSHNKAESFEEILKHNTKALYRSGIREVQVRLRMISVSLEGSVVTRETPKTLKTLKVSGWDRTAGIASATLLECEYILDMAAMYNWPTQMLELEWKGPLEATRLPMGRFLPTSRERFETTRPEGSQHMHVTETVSLGHQPEVGDEIVVQIIPMKVDLDSPVFSEMFIGYETIISTRRAPTVTVDGESVRWDLAKQRLTFTSQYDGEPDMVKDLLMAQVVSSSGNPNQFVLDTQPGSDNWASLHQSSKHALISIPTPSQSKMPTMRHLSMGMGLRLNGKPDGPLGITWGPRMVMNYFRPKAEQPERTSSMIEIEF